MKPKYFNDYFNLQRPLYEELKDIPSANYLNGEDNLMSKYSAFNLEDLGELTFDYKNNKSIRELIYNLAYYQKQIDQVYLSEGELLKAYKKIYKR